MLKFSPIMKKDKRSDLEKQRDKAVQMLDTMTPGTDEYKDQLDLVERLNKLVAEEKSEKKAVSPDTVISVLGTVGLGITQVLLVTKHETFNTITSKAMNLIMKGRIK